TMTDPGVPRHGQAIYQGDVEVGTVTSGTKSPTLGTFIGLAYVAREQSAVGTRLAVDVRGRHHAAHVVPKPFYRRPRGERRSGRCRYRTTSNTRMTTSGSASRVRRGSWASPTSPRMP